MIVYSTYQDNDEQSGKKITIEKSPDHGEKEVENRTDLFPLLVFRDRDQLG